MKEEQQLVSEHAVCQKERIVYEDGKYGRLNMIALLSKEKQYEAMLSCKQEEQVVQELFQVY